MPASSSACEWPYCTRKWNEIKLSRHIWQRGLLEEAAWFFLNNQPLHILRIWTSLATWRKYAQNEQHCIALLHRKLRIFCITTHSFFIFSRFKSMVLSVQSICLFQTTNQRKWGNIEVGVNWLIMSRKRNNLHRSALFKKGRNMQI